jgi:hypothetical protein
MVGALFEKEFPMFTLKKVLLALALTIAAMVAFVASRPTAFVVTRSLLIRVPANVVFAQVGDFRAWPAWSPWEGLDPAMKKQFGGEAGQVGASYAWDGNDKAGAGKMTITAVEPGSRVDIKLEFYRPWKENYTTDFVLSPVDQGTQVTWSMRGENNFMMKAMTLFMNMDKMVGDDYERGLQRLSAIATKEYASRAVLENALKASEENAAEKAPETPPAILPTDPPPVAAPPASPTP